MPAGANHAWPSVFSGWNLEMAEQVCAGSQIAGADVLDLLTALIDKSLVILDGELNGVARYRLLDTVREYAADRAAAAGELSGLRVAHRDCMLALQERSLEVAFSAADTAWPDRVAVYRRAQAEHANIRAALVCCADRGDATDGLRLCAALRPFWLTSGDAADGLAWLDRMLALDREVPVYLRGKALSIRAELAFDQQDYAAAGESARQSLEFSRADPAGARAAALRVVALLALMNGQVSEATATADASVAAARAAGDEWETGVALIVRAGVIAIKGPMADAERAFDCAVEVVEENRGWGRAQILCGLGRLARTRGDTQSAMRYFRDALAFYRQIDVRSDMASCLAAIGRMALSQADLTLARASLTESLQLSLAAGQRLAVARGLDAQAALAVKSGDVTGALKLAGASQVLGEAIGTVPSAGAGARFAELLETARRQLGQARVTEVLDEGRTMSAHTAFHLIRAVAEAPAEIAADSESGRADPAAGQATSGDQPALAALTRRELEVAVLVARGHTNGAIARELFIALPTVARHIANIFAKLGFSSRAQVAAWVAEHRSDCES